MGALVQLFLQTFLISFSGAAAPGPLMTVVMLRGAGHGALSGPLATLGHGILEVLLVVAVMLGVAGWLQAPEVTAVIALVGGLVLVVLGLLQLRGVVSAQGRTPGQAGGSVVAPAAEPQPQLRERVAAGRIIMEGMLASASNPYWYIWWVTVGAALLAGAGEAGRGGIFVFYAGHIMADLLWLTLVGWLISRGRNFVAGRGYQYLLSSLALLLIGFGIFFVQSGLRAWLA